ncbi:MAG: flagellar basal-body rod protein FlgG [Planctomycetota bacterium]
MAVMALQSAATGLTALSTKLDVTANNLANAATEGFKASRANFEDLFYQEKRLPGVENRNGDRRPTGFYVGLGVKVSGTQLDFSQGALITTERELDVAIVGDGFFQVDVEDDLAPGGIAYTRAGNFSVNGDGELVLASSEGRRLVPGINIPLDATSVDITADGRVNVGIPGQDEPQQVGQLELAGFINPQGLSQLGENLFGETIASGPPVLETPGQGGLGEVRSGFLEGSNVNPTFELIDLIRTQRAFEMNSQTIRAADETLSAVAQLRR